MFPSADQIAHAIVASSRFHKVDPVKVAKRERGGIEYIARSRALIYALMALSDTFGHDERLCRTLGLTETRASTTRWQIANHSLKWWDRKVLELVKAAIPDPSAEPPVRRARAEAPTLPAARETAQTPPAGKPAGPPERKLPPNFGTVGGMGPPRPYSPSRDLISEKASLRNMLADAVRNTAKMPSQN